MNKIIIVLLIFLLSCRKENLLRQVRIEYEITSTSSSPAIIWWANKDEIIQNSFFYVPWSYGFAVYKPFTAIIVASVSANEGDTITVIIRADGIETARVSEIAPIGGDVYIEIQQIIK